MFGFIGFGFDWQHLLWVALPMMGLAMIAQLWLKSTLSKYSEIPNQQGISGAEAAQIILRKAGITDVSVEQAEGFLSDHYSPHEKIVRLSPDIYNGKSIASVGVAAHEVGHAIQHNRHYAPLAIRSLAVPLASIGSMFGYITIAIGMFMGHGQVNAISLIGLGLIGCVALFQLINLPVEFDASNRAVALLPEIGILSPEENVGARKVLAAAAFTYVAATIAAVWELLFWAMRLGLLGGNRRE